MTEIQVRQLASDLLTYAALLFPGDDQVTLAAQWGYASIRFKAATGKTLTAFYLEEPLLAQPYWNSRDLDEEDQND